ncbi:TPA: phage tail protein [Enterobacter hormaechei subsp. xiangfangensis]
MGFYDDLLDLGNTAPGSVSVPDSAAESADNALTTEEPASSEDSGPVAPVIESTDVVESTSTGEDDDDANTVPDSITSRPANTGLRSRFDGNKVFNDLVRDDWMKAIKLNPDCFDALLYRALSPTDVVIGDDGYEVTQAEKIAPNQETLSYADPDIVAVVDCPSEMDDFYAMNDDDENAGIQDDALILRIAAHNITIGSILEWNEDLANGDTIRRWWYVHRKFNYGTASVGTLYYCVPSRSYEGLLDE